MPANRLCSLPLRTAAARGAGRVPEGQRHLPRCRADGTELLGLPHRPARLCQDCQPCRLANARPSLRNPACKGGSARSRSSGQRDACSPPLARAVTLEKPVSPRDEDVTAPNQKGQGLQKLVWWLLSGALSNPGCPTQSPVLSEMRKTQVWRGAVLRISRSR